MAKTSLIVVVAGALALGCTQRKPAADAPAEPAPAATAMTPEEARKIAKEAYIFHYPLVMYYRTMYLQAIDPKSKSYSGGFGKWLHLGTASPSDTDIVTPNNDTPYSYAWIDLRAEPWVVTLPKIEKKRFYTSQWNDLWGFVLDNAGSVFDGNDGVSILLASPTWRGKAPKGVKRVVRGDSAFVGTLTRTQLFTSDDMANVERIQREYELQPLSAYLGKTAPPAAPEIDWKYWEEGAEKTEAFWDYASFVLQLTTPNPQDESIQNRAARIGVVAGPAWDSASLAPDVRKAVLAGMQDAVAEIEKASNQVKDASRFFHTRKGLHRDYFARALGVKMGIFGNWQSVSSYFSVAKDSNGELLDGSKHGYSLRFTSDQLPPVSMFWSMTMYKLPERWLVDNPINRYSIGSSSPDLRKGSDGSITLYFSSESPGTDKQSNWLPTPKAPFWIVMRTYGPGKAILNGTYEMPPVKPTN